MCGRYSLSGPEALLARFGLRSPGDAPLTARFNVAPSQQVPVVVEEEEDEGRQLRPMRWGFRPAWLRERSGAPAPINARAETLLERPLFRGALARQRCLIPADGFYEWVDVPGEKARQPMHLRLKGGGLFAFAGLYALDREGESTCAIVTTSANELVAPIHARMPVILAAEDEGTWLDPRLMHPAGVLGCLRAYPAELMEVVPVAFTRDLRDLDRDPDLAARALGRSASAPPG